MKRHLQTLAAALLVCGFAAAQYPARGRFAPPGTSTADIISATGWTYNGVQSLSTSDVAVSTNSEIYLNGATRTQGFTYDGADIKVLGVSPVTPASDQAINLGKPSVRWSNVFATAINLGTSGVLTWSATNPTATACTSPTRTHGNAVSAQYDVGTSCTGVTTLVLTLTAATNGWECHGYSKTSGKMLVQTADTTTSATLTHVTILGGVVSDFADGEDVVVSCTAR